MIIAIALIAIAVLLVAYLAISAYIARSIMKVPRLPLGATPASVGLTYEDVSFPSRIDRLNLKGWYIAGNNPSTIIIVTGMHQNRVDYEIGVLNMSRDLAARGYNILLVDLRGRGESEGRGVLLTNTGRDIGGAVDYIKGRGCPAEQIVLMGFSAGAAASIIFASRECTAAVVCDSCFADVAETFIGKGVSASGLPRWLIKFFGLVTLLMSRAIYGYRKVNPIDCVPAVACPILFIQGSKDDLVSIKDADRLIKASGKPLDELWLVLEAGHTLSYTADPAGYISHVIALLEKVKESAASHG